MPTYDVPAPFYLRALAAGLGSSVICGVIVQILPLFVPIFFLSFFAALIAGGIIAKAISRVTSYKRGRGLQIVAGISVIVGYVLGTFFVAAFMFGVGALLMVPVSLLNLYYWIYPAVAVAVAVSRLR